MSYTNSNGLPQGIPHSFLNKIRESLIGEIVAINGYENHIANSHMEEINNVWESILKDEKMHYGMFLNLLRKYDISEHQVYIDHQKDKIGVTPMQLYKPDYDKQIILNNVREDIKGELEAVILYEQIQGEVPYKDVKDTFDIIIKDEKEHAEHLTNVLLRYDSDKYNDISY